MKKLNIAIYGVSNPSAYSMWQCLEGDHRISPHDSRDFPGSAAAVSDQLTTNNAEHALYKPVEAILCEFNEFVEIKPYIRSTGALQKKQGNRIHVLILNSLKMTRNEIDRFAAAADVDVTFSNINIPTDRIEDLYFMKEVSLISSSSEETDFWNEFLANTFPNLRGADL